jgi:hypothetical protein
MWSDIESVAERAASGSFVESWCISSMFIPAMSLWLCCCVLCEVWDCCAATPVETSSAAATKMAVRFVFMMVLAIPSTRLTCGAEKYFNVLRRCARSAIWPIKKYGGSVLPSLHLGGAADQQLWLAGWTPVPRHFPSSGLNPGAAGKLRPAAARIMQ